MLDGCELVLVASALGIAKSALGESYGAGCSPQEELATVACGLRCENGVRVLVGAVGVESGLGLGVSRLGCRELGLLLDDARASFFELGARDGDYGGVVDRSSGSNALETVAPGCAANSRDHARGSGSSSWVCSSEMLGFAIQVGAKLAICVPSSPRSKSCAW